MTMTISAAGAAFIRRHEGFVPRWYRDPVGVPTIGIGFTWASDAFRSWWQKHRPGQAFASGATMTREEADDALREVIAGEYGAAVNRFLGREVPQHVFDAASSAVFNLGPGSLEWRWAAAMKRADYDEAADLLRSTGTTARGKTLPGLVRRRKEEAVLMASGDYGAGGGLAKTDAMADGMLVRGERGDGVMALQRDLKALGHYDGALDGVFGYGTEAGVMAFQRGAALAEDGHAGPKTLAALAKARAPVPVGVGVNLRLPAGAAPMGIPSGFAIPTPTPRPQPPVSPPAATPAPAPIGHNGGPPLVAPEPVMKPNLTPIEQMNKPVQGAKAGLGASTFGGAVVLLLPSAGWLPEAWQSGEAAIALGLVAGALCGQIGSFVGAYMARDKRFQAPAA